jgi:hypothetical protein
MSFRRFILLLALFAAPAAARQMIGAFATWGTFCDEPRKCFAISTPAERRGKPFLSIAVVGPTLVVRAHLGRTTRRASLAINGERFPLTVAGQDAVADARVTHRILAAMRAWSVEGRTAGVAWRGRARRQAGEAARQAIVALDL